MFSHLIFKLVDPVYSAQNGECTKVIGMSEFHQPKVFEDLLNDQVDLWEQNDCLKSLLEQLTREKGMFGPERGSKRFDKWKLDMCEGPHRMRKKLTKNDLFFVHYPYRVDYDTMHTR